MNGFILSILKLGMLVGPLLALGGLTGSAPGMLFLGIGWTFVAWIATTEETASEKRKAEREKITAQGGHHPPPAWLVAAAAQLEEKQKSRPTPPSSEPT